MSALRHEIKRLERLAAPKRKIVAKGQNVSYEFHSTQINLCDNMSEKDFNYCRVQQQIPDEAIYRELPQKPGMLGMLCDDPEESYGLETKPHLTILYGLTNEADYFKIRRDMSSIQTLEVTIGDISSFRRPEKPYDVLKFSVVSQTLTNLHNELKSKYDNKDSFPEYNPHITLAYVKKGACVDLEGPCSWTGTTIKITCAVFSHRDGYQLPLPVGFTA